MQLIKKYQKLSFFIICMLCSLLVFTFPASAASDTWSQFSVSVNDAITPGSTPLLGWNQVTQTWDVMDRFDYHSDNSNYYSASLYNQESLYVLPLDFQDIILSPGDSIYVGVDSSVGGWIGKPLKTIYFCLLDKDYNVLAWQPYEVNSTTSGNWSASFVLPFERTVQKDMSVSYIGFRFITSEASVNSIFSINRSGNFIIGYGNKNSAAYPGYDGTDTSNIENFESLEQDVLHGTSAGLGEVSLTFEKAASILSSGSVHKGLYAVTQIFNDIMFDVPVLNNIITFSLVLGSAAFIIGTGIWVVRSVKK